MSSVPASLPASDEPIDPVPRWVEWLMGLLALAVVPALLLEARGTTPAVREAARLANWIVWLAFVAEYVWRFSVAPRKWPFVRYRWFDLLLILITPPFFIPDSMEGARTLRVMRLLRVLGIASIGWRASRHALATSRIQFVGAVGLFTVGLGAVGAYLAEAGRNESIHTFGDAIWWSVVTATTVGYGDVSPVTLEGRLVAVLLMVTGIGIIGVFTATVAGLFLDEQQAVAPPPVDPVALEARLSAIERKLDRLLERR